MYEQNESGIYVPDRKIIQPTTWANTHEFRREALNFEKYGYYTSAPVGTRAHKEYWDEQEKRCIEGYSVAGQRITGEHYFYLNFQQIRLTKKSKTADLQETLGGVVRDKKRAARKVVFFPDFWDTDAEYFLECEKALAEGQHMIVLKARRKGYSFKNGSKAAYIYSFYRNSTTLIGAFDKKYLYPEGTMAMASNYLNFLNEHTDWAKRRLIDKYEHKKSGFKEKVNGIDMEKGYLSQIIALSFGDNPDAARGKDAYLIIMEEAGKFPNLKASYNATRPTVEDGDFVTGQIYVFGTGGGDNDDWADFADMFYNPQLYNFRAYDNVYDEDGHGTSIGFFVPNYKSKPGFIDKDGNSMIDEALASDYREREKVKNTAKSPKDLTDFILEYCHTPREATTISGSNIFPTAQLHSWRRELVTTPKYSAMMSHGDLYRESNGQVKFKLNHDAKPLNQFPLKDLSERKGCVTIYWSPYREFVPDGKGGGRSVIPDNLYFISYDPYGVGSEHGESLGAVYVLCRPNKYTTPDNCIVASYIGRLEDHDEFNKTVFLLAEYYNAQIAVENDRGEHVIAYAKSNKLLDYLVPEFDIISKKDPNYKSLGRKYGMSMRDELRKMTGALYLKKWLTSPRGKGDDGTQRLNLHLIYDLALIDELLRYNPEKNFDRVSSMMMAMFYMYDLYDTEVRAASEKNPYDTFRNLFGN